MKFKHLLRELGESALVLSGAALTVKLLGMIYKIPLTYILGAEGMGYFNSAYTIYGFFYTVCATGVPKAVTIFIKQEEACDGDGLAELVYKKTRNFFAAFGAFATLLYILLARPLSYLIGNSASLYSIFSIGPSIFFVVLGGVARGYLAVKGRFFDIAFSQLIEAASKLVFGLAFALYGYKVSLPIPLISGASILGITLGSALSALYLLLRIKSFKPQDKTGQKMILDTQYIVRGVLKIGAPITLSASFLSLAAVIDLGIIMRCLSGIGYSEAEASVEYGVFTTLAIPMLMLVSAVVTPICIPLLPRLTEINRNGDSAAFSCELGSAIGKMCLICVPSAICFALFPFDILDILFSPQDSILGGELLALISPSVILLPVLTAVNTALEASGRIGSTVASLIVGSVFKSVIGIYLISTPAVGIHGAAISTTASYLVSLIYSTVSLVQLKLGRGILVNFAVPLALSATAFLPVYMLIYLSNPLNNHTVNVVLSGGLGALLYGTFLFIFLRMKNKSENFSSKYTKQRDDI